MAYQQQQQQQPIYNLTSTRSLRITKRPEPIQIKRSDTIKQLKKETLEEQKSPESLKSPSSEVSANSSSNSLIGYNQNNNYSGSDIVSGGGNGYMVSPDSGSGGGGYGHHGGSGGGGGGGSIDVVSNYSDGVSLINSIINFSTEPNNDPDANDVSPGGVYLNDNSQYDNDQYDNQKYDNRQYDSQQYDNQQYDNQQYDDGQQYDGQQYDSQQYDDQRYDSQQYDNVNVNDYNKNSMSSSSSTSLTLTANNTPRNGGGIPRVKGVAIRNRLDEIFEEPINLSECISSSDKDIWLLKLFSKLSNDLNKIFKNSVDFDIVIEVGQGKNTKIFNAHSTILRARSPFFSNAINNVWVRDEQGKFYFKKENVTPKVFECIISYLYTGMIKITHLVPGEILELLVACDEIILGELIDYLQGHLIANHYKWFQQNIVLIQKISFQHDSFAKLQKFCTTLVFDNPKILFHSKDFTVVDKDFFLMLLNQDDLVMEENEIWDYVIHWGRSQDQNLSKNLNLWSSEDFRMLGYTLKDFIPLIRFSEISSKDFYKKVKPFSQVLGTNLYEELLQHYLVADSQPNSELLTKKRKQKNLDSLLISQLHLGLISSWIDRKDKPYDDVTTPYKFELLLRGTKDDFTAQTFHDHCDYVERTVVIMRVKGTTKLVGGFNPVFWNDDTSSGNSSSGSNNVGADGSGGVGGGYFIETKDSFIFTFDAKKPKKNILSRVSNSDKAIYHHENTGLNFLDLKMRGNSQDDEKCYYRQFVYDKNLKIKTSKENNFSIDEYEVFRVIAL